MRQGARTTSIVLGAAIVAGVLGRSIELVLPVILDSAGRGLGLSNAGLGLFAGAELAGVTLCSLAAFRLGKWLAPGPTALFGALMLAATNLLTGYAETLLPIILLRFAAGLLGEGALLVVAVSLLGSGRNAARIYGAFMALQMLFGAGALVGFGMADTAGGFTAVMQLAAAICVGGVIAAVFLPWHQVIDGRDRTSTGGPGNAGMWMALAGMGIFHIGLAGAWAFMQQKATSLGLDAATGGGLLAVMMLSGLAGTLYVVLRGAPRGILTGTCLVYAAAAVTGMSTGNPVIFTLAGIALMVAWNLSVPGQVALLGVELKGADHLPLVPGFQGVGLAGGPVVAGLVSSPGQYAGLAALVLLAAGLSMFLFITASHYADRS